jgi:hypothetical protein
VTYQYTPGAGGRACDRKGNEICGTYEGQEARIIVRTDALIRRDLVSRRVLDDLQEKILAKLPNHADYACMRTLDQPALYWHQVQVCGWYGAPT